MNTQYDYKKTKSNTPQHIETRLTNEVKQLDLSNRYELIRQASERIQNKL